jgi:outer membrane protein OmpA-like peptidoglycan-associated protein
MVNGYTDNTGTPMLNEQLSFLRARLVRETIVKGGGFPEELVQHQGWGEASPLVDNDTEEGRYTNRRVEIIIRK